MTLSTDSFVTSDGTVTQEKTGFRNTANATTVAIGTCAESTGSLIGTLSVDLTEFGSYTFVLTVPAGITAAYDPSIKKFSFDVRFALLYTLENSAAAHGVTVTPSETFTLTNGDASCTMRNNNGAASMVMSSTAGSETRELPLSATYTYTSDEHDAEIGTYTGNLSFTITSS